MRGGVVNRRREVETSTRGQTRPKGREEPVMQIPLESILRRLMLLGLPLTPVLATGCAKLPPGAADWQDADLHAMVVVDAPISLPPDMGVVDGSWDAPDPDAMAASDAYEAGGEGGADAVVCRSSDARYGGDAPVERPMRDPAPLCVGTWGSYQQPYCGGANSIIGSEWRLIDPDDPEQVSLYAACAQGDCGRLCSIVYSDYFCAPSVGNLGMVICQAACEPTSQQAGLNARLWPSGACLGGRRPAGLLADRRRLRGNEVGAFFARAARMEAASVPAFAQLATELAAHGGGASLIRRARRAMGEEARHFLSTARLAARFSTRVPLPRVRAMPVRPLEEVAAENAAEGCVNETYAALMALHQAAAARDRRVRAAMTAIAADELRHADLSWAIDGWCRAQLSPAARRRVDQRRAQAREALVASAAGDPASPALRHWAGLPDGERAVTMAQAVFRAA
jgi:hypothetical protein